MREDRNRLAACRACGNRVARDARRCPACGTRDPNAPDQGAARPEAAPPAAPLPRVSRPETVFTPPGPRAASAPPRPAARRRRGVLPAMLLAVLGLAAAGIALVHVTAPTLTMAPSPPEPAPVPVAAAPPPSPPAPSAPAPAAPSRSRGQRDWLFFFKPGDWLARMADDALLGVVVRLEKIHTFTDGSKGPAYVVQSMEGDERVVDADELERSARLR